MTAKIRGHHGKTKEEIIVRREESFRLRVIERLDYRAIGIKMGIAAGTAKKDCDWVLDQKKKGLIERDEEIRSKETHIYEALLDRWLPLAIQRGEDQLAAVATDKVTKILVDMARLHGFASPQREAPASEMGKQIGISIIETMAKLAQSGKPIKAELVETVEAIEDKNANT